MVGERASWSLLVGFGAIQKWLKSSLVVKRELLKAALVGRFRPHHGFLLSEHLSPIDDLDGAIAHFSDEITQHLKAEEETLTRMDMIPGLSRHSAEHLVAEIGLELTRFPTAKHLASRGLVCVRATIRALAPRKRVKRGRGTTGYAKSSWKPLMVLLRLKYLPRCIVPSLERPPGQKESLSRGGPCHLGDCLPCHKAQVPYKDLGENYFDERDRQAVKRQLVRRLESLGYQVERLATPGNSLSMCS